MHDVSIAREFITEQMLPILQGEKATSLLEVVGCMINCAPALQADVESGQQELVSVQPELHYGCDGRKSVESHRIGDKLLLTSCIAPKLCPIS